MKPLKNHRVELVSGTPFRVTCIACQKQGYSDRQPFYADLDGKPWVDYYCEPCADRLGACVYPQTLREPA